MLFQTPINRASNPVTLSLERRITSISQQASSPYLLPQILFWGNVLYLKSFTVSALGWMFTSPLSLPVSLLPINREWRPTITNGFLPLLGIYATVQFGWLRMTAKMCAWISHGSIRFPSTTFWNAPAPLSSLTLNMRKRFEIRKPLKATPSGLPTSSNTTLLQGVLSLRQISANFGICFVIVENLPVLPLVRRTERKTVWPSPTSNGTMYSQMYSTKQPPQ